VGRAGREFDLVPGVLAKLVEGVAEEIPTLGDARHDLAALVAAELDDRRGLGRGAADDPPGDEDSVGIAPLPDDATEDLLHEIDPCVAREGSPSAPSYAPQRGSHGRLAMARRPEPPAT